MGVRKLWDILYVVWWSIHLLYRGVHTRFIFGKELLLKQNIALT